MVFFREDDLSSKIKILEGENKQLKEQLSQCNDYISDLTHEMENIKKQNCMLIKKYEDTGLECSFCYNVIREGFKFCPNCGKSTVKAPRVISSNANRFQVESDGEDVIITGYTGFDDTSVVVPGEINGRKVVGIWNNAFSKCESIEEIVIEDGCQYIGNYAFSSCISLTTIILPKSLIEIGRGAFTGCKELKEIVIPVNVIRIGGDAFDGCLSLTSVILPPNLRIIEDSLLSGTSIENIDIPDSVKVIESRAFQNTQLRKVSLPKNLYSIYEKAFADCYLLTEITMHSNIKALEKDIFQVII